MMVLHLRRLTGRVTIALAAVLALPAAASADGTVTTTSGISVPDITMQAPPGAGAFEKLLGYGLWFGAAACFAGVILYVIKAVTAHGFNRNASEHTGALGMALGGALILGVAGSALNGLL